MSQQSIITAIDGSVHSMQALEEAISLANALNLRLVLVNVQPRLQTVHTKMFFSKETIEGYQKQLADEAIAQALGRIREAGVEYETELRTGDPQQEICVVAQEKNAKYILMGSRGMGPVKGQILGSVSYGVLHNAPCPVLVIPSVKK